MPDDLASRRCLPCRGDTPALAAAAAAALLRHLHNDWSIAPDGKSLVREFAFVDFAAALAFAVEVGALAEAADHHPDLAVGWGYCRVRWATHVIRALSENDFICAARTDALVG